MLQGEHSAICSTFIKLPFVIKIFVLSIFEWLFYTGFTVSSIIWFINNENCRNIYSYMGQHEILVLIAYVHTWQGSKIALVRLYLRVPQAAGQVKILIFLVNFFFPHVCAAGQVPILRYCGAAWYMWTASEPWCLAMGWTWKWDK